MFRKLFDDISIEDIRSLQNSGVPEGKSIDYKEALHLGKADEKKEFAADITSFSNTVGGYLVFGVKEEGGVITEIKGFDFGNQDELKLQIENILRDTVEPRIIGLQMKFIDLENGKSIFIVNIPRSYNGPHIVRGKEFYGRNTSGNYRLDYSEIKRKFLEHDGIIKDIKNHHLERVFKIKANEGYIPLVSGPSILLQVIPIQAFGYDAKLINLGNPMDGRFWPLSRGGADPHIGFEGIAWFNQYETNLVHGYHHMDRRGIVEIVDRYILRSTPDGCIGISTSYLIEKLKAVSNDIIYNFTKYEISGPFIVTFALLDVKDARFYVVNGFYGKQSITQNDLIFPEVFINDMNDFSLFIEQTESLLFNAAGNLSRNSR
jgi:hypothetical protein